MGRGRPVDPPPVYQPAEIRYGNQVVGKTFVDPGTGTIVNQYLPDPAEEARKREAQQRINEIVASLGKTAPELATQYNQTEQAFVDDATKKFNQQYDPALRSLREDVASRFGTLNTSEFINGLNSLESNRTGAISDIVNRGKLLRNDLVNQEEARKLSQLQALGGVLSDAQSALLQNTRSTLSASQALNDFLNSAWMNNLRNYTTQNQARKQTLPDIFNTAGQLLKYL
jgi:hypothetical protein